MVAALLENAETLGTCSHATPCLACIFPIAELPGGGVWNHQTEEGPDLSSAEQGGRRGLAAGRGQGCQQRDRTKGLCR